jgi:hypothetical protein
MTSNMSIGLAIAFGWAISSSQASGQGPERPGTPQGEESREGNGPRMTATRERPTPVRPDFKVVFWFDGATPRHQVYDVRKGQYTRAVEDWVHRHQEEIDEFGYASPGAMAIVRDISLEDEPGRTEQEKLEAGVRRISQTVYAVAPAALSRLVKRYVQDSRCTGGPKIGGPRRPMRPLPEVGPGRWEDRSYLDNPRPDAFPVPYPYPRPHP